MCSCYTCIQVLSGQVNVLMLYKYSSVCIRSGKCAHAIKVFKCVSGQVNVLMLYMYSSMYQVR